MSSGPTFFADFSITSMELDLAREKSTKDRDVSLAGTWGGLLCPIFAIFALFDTPPSPSSPTTSAPAC
jgi:hypothetical protein